MTALQGLTTVPAAMALPQNINVIDAVQARAARAVLGMSSRQVAASAGLSESSIRRVETGTIRTVGVSTLLRLQAHYEQAGIEFVWNHGRRGVVWEHQSLALTLATSK